MTHFYRFATSIAAVAIAAPALAGEEIRYEQAPDWVSAAELPPAKQDAGKPFRLLDQQVRLEDGLVSAYADIAVAFATPETLTQMGTVTAQWLPDKGDLIVHRMEILRGDETIDLIGQGVRFETLRRETMLERRMLDGALTATLAVPGLRVGDTLRVAYSVTRIDQALGKEMEWASILLPEPMPIARGSVVASWPQGADIAFRDTSENVTEPVDAGGGYRKIAVALPVAKADEMPGDAPDRFRMPALLQLSSFGGWQDVSRVMAPHYDTTGTIAPGSPLAEQVANIAAKTDDPLWRAAAATRLVQDEVSYLLNGLNGGNYLPQMPAETWKNRFGDCKAKSVLLLAMLRELGVAAEPVLVRISGGDAVADMLPQPGVFDHMIVRADIGGEPYWLDGTSGGTRLANIGEVPRFGYALPLREGGAELQKLAMRPQSVPNQFLTVNVDQSAGVDVPALFDARMEYTGAAATQLRAMEQLEDGEQRDNALYAALASAIGAFQPVETSFSFDEESGVATIRAEGLMTTPWQLEDGKYRLEVPYQPLSGFQFDVDRARPEWRGLPVKVNGPLYQKAQVNWLLPDGGKGYSLRGTSEIDTIIGGTKVSSSSRLEKAKFALEQKVKSLEWEIAADQLPQVKRDTLRLTRALPVLSAPADTKRAWQYSSGSRSALKPIEDAYAALIAKADEPEADDYINRASFRTGTGDWKGARADWDAAIAIEPSRTLYWQRAETLEQLGDLEAALADYRIAEDMEPNGETYWGQTQLLGLLGRGDEAFALADDYALIAADPEEAERFSAYVNGWAGRSEDGLAIMRGLAEAAPAQSTLYNEYCWYAGTRNLVDDDVLEACMQAVEQSSGSQAALDSRALAYFRQGRADEALADLEKVMAASPDQHASRYLRGVIRLAQGEKDGAQDIAIALAAQPALARTYANYGLAEPR